MKTDSIDTNIVLRYILGDIPEKRQQAADFFKHSESTHHFSNQAILECIYVMEMALEMPRTEIADLMNFFLARYSDKLEYDRDMTAIAFPYYLRHPKLSWADCALAAEAKSKNREPLYTYDKKLAAQLSEAKLLA